MSNKFASSAFALCILASGLVARPILAATPSASFAVTATVQAGCLVSPAASAYWIYTAPVTNAISAVSVTCTNAAPYVVDLRAGLASGATVSDRRMTGPVSALLGFEPVSKFPAIVNWSQTVGNDKAQIWNLSSPALSVVSQVLARQYVAASAYGDTITVTVTY
jgi:spore coat protein U-like protein